MSAYNQYLNCDALDYMRQMPAESVDLIVTDPPYRTLGGGGNSRKYGGGVIKANDTKIFKHNDVSIAEMFPLLYRVLRFGCHAYVMSNRINLREMLNCADDAGFHLHNILRWDKPNVQPNRWYMLDCEYTLFLAKKPVREINHMGSKQGFSAKVDKPKFHPTQKPIALMEHYILNSSEPGQVVFDPFAGVGSTLIAAARNGRQYIGCEIDPMYYNVGLVRLYNETSVM